MTTSSDEKMPFMGIGVTGLVWAMVEWARNPYYNIVIIFAFMPYFSETVLGGGPDGQAAVADIIKSAGFVMVVVAPVLGVLVDKGGSKKAAMLCAFVPLVGSAGILVFVRPEFPGAVPVGMGALVVGNCLYAVSAVLHNALLPQAGPYKSLPFISGLGLLMGNLASGLMLIALLIASETIPVFESVPGGIGVFSGLVVAIWMSVFILPFFLFMPDQTGSLKSWRRAFVQTFTPPNFRLWGRPPGVNYVWSLVINPVILVVDKCRQFPNVMLYLFARMIYVDGIAVVFLLGGVYVTGFLDWPVEQVIVYGILASVVGALGGFVGGMLDSRFGPKRALIMELISVIVVMSLMMSVTQNTILFGLVPSGHDVWTGFGTGLFTTLGDLFYCLMLFPLAIMIVACLTSSRYMLVHVTPPERLGEFFGFYAMAEKVTAWIAPLIVAAMTRTFDERIGFASTCILFVIGLVILCFVRAGKQPEYSPQ